MFLLQYLRLTIVISVNYLVVYQGNTTANNQNFVTHYYNQSGGFVLVPGTFIRLYDAFYPKHLYLL